MSKPQTPLHDPATRTALGLQLQADYTASPPRDAVTLMQQSWRDFVYAEIWSRPALDLRARFLISLAGAANIGHAHAINAYARGALATGSLTLGELREAALHVAVYCGWSAGSLMDAQVSRAADDLAIAPVQTPPICDTPWDPKARVEKGISEFNKVMGFPGPPPVTPYFEAGIDSFVFGEMWHRAGLDQRSRRFLTLVGVSESCAVIPIKTHFYAALASGNCTAEELNEFVLHYAVHAGWPKASVIQGAVLEMAKNFAAGLDWQGKEKSA
jgi:4-carboxymuconolactone decarboxylase